MITILVNNVPLIITCFLGSIGSCIIVIVTKKYHIRFSSRELRGKEVQSMHREPTSRLGSLGVIIPLIFLFLLWDHPEIHIYNYLLCSILFFYFFGLAEDLNIYIRPKWRLLSVVASGFFMILLSGVWLIHVSTPFIEPLFRISVIAICFTVFAVTGVAHSINLIDGLNGLSLTVVSTIALCLSIISNASDDQFMTLMGVFIVTTSLGVFLFNFPYGRLFLGDAGAYSLGYILAWFAILIIFRNPQISAWSVLLCFFWPVMETIFSIYRRLTNNKFLSQADANHFHHLVYRFLEARFEIFKDTKYVNPCATLLMLPFMITPSVLSVFLVSNSYASVTLIMVFAIFYIFFHQIKLKSYHE